MIRLPTLPFVTTFRRDSPTLCVSVAGNAGQVKLLLFILLPVFVAHIDYSADDANDSVDGAEGVEQYGKQFNNLCHMVFSFSLYYSCLRGGTST